jgi:hypothetical protein
MFVASAVIYAEWGTWSIPNSSNVATGVEQDGSWLSVMCDADVKFLTFGFQEPRANWQKGKGKYIHVIRRPDNDPVSRTINRPATIRSLLSPEACEAARPQVIKDAERMSQEMLERAKRSGGGVGGVLAMAAIANAPSVSAICVAQ